MSGVSNSLSKLDDNLNLSENAPLIAAATAAYMTGGASLGADPGSAALAAEVGGTAAATGAGLSPYASQAAGMYGAGGAGAAGAGAGSGLLAGLGNMSMGTKMALGLSGLGLLGAGDRELSPVEEYDGPLNRFTFDPDQYQASNIRPPTPYRPVYTDYRMAMGGLTPTSMSGGISDLGSYSDGGRMLRGPGDGVSDSIPATIGGNQPAQLADGEFVVPARAVSELGNGSSEAGARKLYAMLDRIQAARSKTVGKEAVAVDSKASRHLPA